MQHGTQELPVIQKVYDLIKWYIPILNRLPKDHRFGLGERMIAQLYEMLEGLVQARYLTKNRAYRLEVVNTNLDILRYQTPSSHLNECLALPVLK
ncbi:MAG: diversity-generating retroelement protein Avd [Leptolyngbyaceae bacterium]|nr:diversity-generating retroelement protein Avd [Leptolyngbyaceae bacterium]